MKPKDILDLISEYSEYYNAKSVKDNILRPLLLLHPQKVSAVIPSFSMGKDGEYIETLFLFTENIICEVRLTNEKSYEYDFININTIANIRYEGGTDTFTGAGEPRSYKYTKVVLLHMVGGFDFKSVLAYIGESPDKWLEKVKDVLPVELLI